jgi:HD superfamily phosphodiesterase
MEPELVAFGQKAYSKYDSSHDWNHALAVEANTRLIMAHSAMLYYMTYLARHADLEQIKKTIRFTAILHDALDHKYAGQWTITPTELREFLEKHLGPKFSKMAMYTIENMSWSKRDKENVNLIPTSIARATDDGYNELIFHTVRDADWIEAIDIDRAMAYTKTRGETTGDVVRHVDEKLIKIKGSLFFTASAKIAEPKHEALIQWRSQF